MDELITLLEKQRQGYFTALMKGSMRFKKDDGSDYGDWEERELGDFIRIETGDLIDRSRFSVLKTDRHIYPVRSTGVFIMGYYDDFNCENRIVLSSIDNLGIANRQDGKFWNNKSGMIIEISRISLIDEKYLFYALEFLKPEFRKVSMGTVIDHLYPSSVIGVRIQLPSKEEQIKIADFIEKLDKNIGNKK